MVIDGAYEGQTVFHVFAVRARRRSRRSLRAQAIAGSVAAGTVILLAPAWWPVAAALGAAAGYASWGILDRMPRSLHNRLGLRILAAITTMLLLLAVTGMGLAAFTGDARSPYGTCYDANGRAFPCDARGQRRS